MNENQWQVYNYEKNGIDEPSKQSETRKLHLKQIEAKLTGAIHDSLMRSNQSRYRRRVKRR